MNEIQLTIGAQITQVGSTAVWTVTQILSRGTIGATLNVRSGKPSEVYYRKITKAQRANWKNA